MPLSTSLLIERSLSCRGKILNYSAHVERFQNMYLIKCKLDVTLFVIVFYWGWMLCLYGIMWENFNFVDIKKNLMVAVIALMKRSIFHLCSFYSRRRALDTFYTYYIHTLLTVLWIWKLPLGNNLSGTQTSPFKVLQIISECFCRNVVSRSSCK